ncbi:hypothetical protein [Paraburkholderia hayleyella]|uniref:hypothetical protein n=1 Tax=Paraburkholderia hayleyella TaxID=2152889 RepID=UPI001292BB3B|nr:hypothetical protein [Paraburkholderia hayleyella]
MSSTRPEKALKIAKMPRPLAPHEYKLLDFLLEVNEPLYGKWTRQWRDQIKTCQVKEIDTPYYLAICHEENIEKHGKWSGALARILVSIDENIPVIISALILSTEENYYVDGFSIDRMDGEPLKKYPLPGENLMIMEAGKWIGGADLRRFYGESDLPPPDKFEDKP